MKVSADITQLENSGMYLNIQNDDYLNLGIWTSCLYKKVFYQRENIQYFMIFKDSECRKEFESNLFDFKIIWESE